MKRRVILVAHDDGPRDDRASAYLVRRGVEVEWTCPAEGEALPEPNGAFDGAIVYGGVQSANAGDELAYIRDELAWIERWAAAGKSFLGLCLGAQLLAHSLGARVAHHPDGLHERGFVEIHPTAAGQAVLEQPLHVYGAHNEGFDVPAGAELLFAGTTYPHQGFRYGRNAYAFQFHPECTPEMMVRWMDLDASKLNHPGVHPRARQIADSERYDGPMADWFEDFLDGWLDGTMPE